MIYGREGMMALLLGVFFDLLIGDPHCFYHPIRLVGNLISLRKKGFGRFFQRQNRRKNSRCISVSDRLQRNSRSGGSCAVSGRKNPSVSASGCDGIVLLLDAGGKISER